MKTRTTSGRRAGERPEGEAADRAGEAADRAGDAPVLRVGVAGAGLIAQLVHLPTLQALARRFALAGVADPSPAARETIAARYEVRAVGDHRELLSAGDLDALIVCSPNETHAAVTLDALDAGLHVLVEKPLCLTLADADRIEARARKRGLVVQVGYMKRFEPAYESLLAALGAAPDTRLRHLTTTTIDPGLAAAMAPAGVVAPAGGAREPDAFSDVLLGALVHDVNLAHGVLDRLGHEVVRVADAAAGPAAATATVELSGGARWSMAWLLEPAAGEFTEELLACTTAGVHRLSFPAPYQRPSAATHLHTAGGAGRWTATASRGYADAYARQLEHFHACATAGAACRTPVAQARRDIALLTDLLHAGAAA